MVNNKKNRLKRPRSRSSSKESRSRSPTPTKDVPQRRMASRAFLMGLLAGNSVMDAQVCGSHINVMEMVEATNAPEEELEELMKIAPKHLQRWMESFGYTCAVPPTANAETGKVSPCDGVCITVTPDIDAIHPSASAITVQKVEPFKEFTEGSELDSEFDDEFDFVNSGSHGSSDINFDSILKNIEQGMDDEMDRRLGVAASFAWQKGFETFRANPMEFHGNIPGPVKDYDSAYDAFVDIWDSDIINLIARETNLYVEQKRARKNRARKWKETNADEIMILLAMFIAMSLNPRPLEEEFWDSGTLCMPGFVRLMACNRYKALCKVLHFVDNTNESFMFAKEDESLKLLKISPIIAHLESKFQTLYSLDKNICISESLTLPNKAHRMRIFGIKSYELYEANTGYIYRMKFYNAGNSDDDESLIDSLQCAEIGFKRVNILLNLLETLKYKGHCVTLDQVYASPSMVRYLKSLGFDCLGSVRSNRRHVPGVIVRMSKDVSVGSISSHQCGDISIVSWNDSDQMVNIISTYHDDTVSSESKGSAHVKPDCLQEYEQNMIGHHRKPLMNIPERKRGLKWYLKIFKRLLNASILNAYVLYVSSLKRRQKVPVTQREFRYELAQAITAKHFVDHADQLMRLRQDIIHEPGYFSGRGSRRRCIVCYQRTKTCKQVRTQCMTCGVHLCFKVCWKEWHTAEHMRAPGERESKKKKNQVAAKVEPIEPVIPEPVPVIKQEPVENQISEEPKPKYKWKSIYWQSKKKKNLVEETSTSEPVVSQE